jgi:hypothetical protein
VGVALLDESTPYDQAIRLVDEFNIRGEVQRLRMQLQDSWLLAYLLVDPGMSSQPPNRERYWTPRTASVVDTARRVLSRNPLKFRVSSQHFAAESREGREPQRVLENVLHGALYDIDRQLKNNGQLSSRQQTAFHALVRGAWAYKLHMTNKSRSSTGSPIHYRQLDPRLVLPSFDEGMESAVAFNITTLGQLIHTYRDIIQPVIDRVVRNKRRQNGKVTYDFLHVPLQVLEWSSRDEHALLLDLSGLDDEIQRGLGIDRDGAPSQYVWLEAPFRTGLDHSIIQYGNVNGIPLGLASKEAVEYLQKSPFFGTPTTDGSGTTTGLNMQPRLILPNGVAYAGERHSVDPMGAFAGRSIFATIQHLIPEFNRLMAMLKDVVVRETRGTWAFRSRDGRGMTLHVGDGLVNQMTLTEQLERIPTQLQAPDALALLQLVSQEISDGSLDLRFILAAESEGSGFLRARMEQAALVAVEDYKDGQQTWGESVANSVVSQLRSSPKRTFNKWTIQGREPGESSEFFVVNIDDQVFDAIGGTGKRAKEPPVIEAKVKAAMPIDMMARINMAKAAVDPSNPIMSLAMALDLIMEFDDSDAAYDSIIEDIGNRHPTIVLIRLADAFERNGASEVAQAILQDEFRQAFATAAQSQSAATATPAGATPGINPGTTPPEITSGGGTEARTQAAPVAQ